MISHHLEQYSSNITAANTKKALHTLYPNRALGVMNEHFNH